MLIFLFHLALSIEVSLSDALSIELFPDDTLSP
jgi:hypothetical protein